MLADKIAQIEREVALLEAIRQDFAMEKIPVTNMRTDAVYAMFRERHPDVEVTQRRFTRILAQELGLKSKQAWLDGVRGYFYE